MESIHPIEGLMQAAMSNIKSMVDVNTIIGDPIEVANNTVIIPISKVCFGFAAGGSEFNEEVIEEYKKKDKDDEEIKYKLPFGGGTGAGVSINPIAFVVIQGKNVKLLPVNHSSTIDRLIDYIPDILEKIESKLGKKDKDEVKEEIKDVLNEEKRNKREVQKEEYEMEYEEDEEMDD